MTTLPASYNKKEMLRKAQLLREGEKSLRGRPLESSYNLQNLKKVLTPNGGRLLNRKTAAKSTLGHKKHFSISTHAPIDPLTSQHEYNSADEGGPKGYGEHSIDSLNNRHRPSQAPSPLTAKMGGFNLPSLK